MPSFRVVACNSGCCAIKHIRDFTKDPDDTLFTLKSNGGHDDDAKTSEPSPYENWAEPLKYTPKTAGEAFREIVAQIKRRRPSGIITVNLVATIEKYGEGDEEEVEYDDSQIQAWQPVMDELDFTKIVVINSNTGNEIHHYTLVYSDKEGEG